MAGFIALAAVGGILVLFSLGWLVRITFRKTSPPALLAVAKKPFVIGIIGLVFLAGGLVPALMQLNVGGEPVLTEFMKAAAAGDADRAFDCCIAQSDLGNVTSYIESNRHLFDNFERLKIDFWEVETTAGVTTGMVTGVVIYADGSQLPFRSLLIKEHGEWKIASFHPG